MNPMPNGPNPKMKFYTLPQTWYGRLLGAVVGAVVLLLAIFFFTFFLIIFAVVAIVATVYLSLFGRRYEQPASPNIILVENMLSEAEDDSEDSDSKKDNSF
jgi:uncharacterized membrane protein YgaE (UPF0421/DUF939 family)